MNDTQSTMDMLDEMLMLAELDELMGDPARLDAECAAIGLDEAELDRVVDLALGPPAVPASSDIPSVAKVVSIQRTKESKVAPRRVQGGSSRWGLLAAAACVTLVVTGGSSTMATWRPTPTVHYSTYVPPPTAKQVAEALRRNGLALCRQAYMGECEDALDKARSLDPDGDSTPEVNDARDLIADDASRTRSDRRNEFYAKPPVGPTERPLQRHGRTR